MIRELEVHIDYKNGVSTSDYDIINKARNIWKNKSITKIIIRKLRNTNINNRI